MNKRIHCDVYGLCWDETGQQCVTMWHNDYGTVVIPVSTLKEALEIVGNDPDYKEE